MTALMLQNQCTMQPRKHVSRTTGLRSRVSEYQHSCWSSSNPDTSQSAGRPSAAAMKAREQELVPQLIRFLLDHPQLKAREKVPPGLCLLNCTHCAWRI